MYPNLQAEQARQGMTNMQVADKLGIARPTYENKKKTGRFTVEECKRLCEMFHSSFDYLFDT